MTLCQHDLKAFYISANYKNKNIFIFSEKFWSDKEKANGDDYKDGDY